MNIEDFTRKIMKMELQPYQLEIMKAVEHYRGDRLVIDWNRRPGKIYMHSLLKSYWRWRLIELLRRKALFNFKT